MWPIKRFFRPVLLVSMFIPFLAAHPRLDENVHAGGVEEKYQVIETGEPISANNGSYHFNMTLLDLGGFIPLRVDLLYRLGAGEGDGGFYHGFETAMDYWSNETMAIATVVSGTGGDEIRFSKNTETPSGQWELAGACTRGYVLEETGTYDTEGNFVDGYFYLMDPFEETVKIFEKSPPDNVRLAYVLDRNGRSLTYTLSGEYEQSGVTYRDLTIHEQTGAAGDRKLVVRYWKESFGDQWHVDKATERIWDPDAGMEQDGRCVQYTYGGCDPDNYSDILCAVTDPAGNTTEFDRLNISAAATIAVTGVSRPLGNVPYTQSVVAVEHNGLTDARVTAQSDAYSNETTFSYSAEGTAVVENRPGGDTAVFDHDLGEWESWGPPRSFTDAAGNQAVFQTDSNNRITATTDRTGDTSYFTYHAQSGKLASVTNAEGNTTSHTYTAQGRTFTNPANAEQIEFTFYDRTRTDFPDGTHEQYAYDSGGNLTGRTDRAGKTWSYAYDGDGRLVSATNPAGGKTFWTYNPDSTLASVTDSGTGTTAFSYDEHKRPVTVTRPDLETVEYAYDLNDRITSVTDENGHATGFVHDANGNLTEVVDAAGNTAGFEYDQIDRMTRKTDRLGKETNYAYNHRNLPTSVTNPNSVVLGLGYDSRDWRNTLTLGGSTWTTGYDKEGVVSSETTPLGFTTSFRTDKLGYTTEIIDPLNHKTTVSRDSMERVVSVQDPLSRLTAYAYESRGLLSGVTLPDGGAATYEYDDTGLLSKIVDIGGGQWTFDYTSMGRLSQSVDPLLHITQYDYDTLGRLSVTTFPDMETATRSYDPAGNLVRILYSDGPDLSFTYDSLNRLTGADGIAFTRDKEGRILTSVDRSVVFGATYDDGGRIETATYNDSSLVVQYTYDETTGLLSQVSDSVTAAQVDFSYDADRRLIGVSRSNGVDAAFTYDNAGRLVRIREGGIIDLKYTVDAAGQVSSVDMTVPLDPAGLSSAQQQLCTYDAACRLTGGNFSYDDRGRLLTDARGTGFAWDGASRLTSIGSVAFSYNGLGDPVARTEGGKTANYYYNHAIFLAPLAGEQDADSGQFTRYYVWAPGGSLLYMIDASDGNKIYYHHFDRTGSTLALTGADGAVTDSYAYSSHGKLLGHQGGSDQPFTFVGRWGVRQEGADGNLYHMRARWYDASSARFVSRDPVWPLIDVPLSLNPYQYAFGDPVRMVDFTGTIPRYEVEPDPYEPTNMFDTSNLYGMSAFFSIYEREGVVGLLIALDKLHKDMNGENDSFIQGLLTEEKWNEFMEMLINFDRAIRRKRKLEAFRRIGEKLKADYYRNDDSNRQISDNRPPHDSICNIASGNDPKPGGWGDDYTVVAPDSSQPDPLDYLTYFPSSWDTVDREPPYRSAQQYAFALFFSDFFYRNPELYSEGPKNKIYQIPPLGHGAF